MMGTRGLVRVRDEHLVALFRAVHRDELQCPITHPGLATTGFLGIADHLEHLRGLDKTAVIAVITAILAERRQKPYGTTEAFLMPSSSGNDFSR